MAIAAVFYSSRTGNDSLFDNSVQVAGIETESNGAENSAQNASRDIVPTISFSNIENPTSSFRKYSFISGDLVMDENGIVRIKPNAISSKKIKWHSIDSNDIGSSAITSRTIKNGSITGRDIDHNTDLTVGSVYSRDTIEAKGDLIIGGNTIVTHGQINVGDKVITQGDIGIGVSVPEAKLHLYQANPTPGEILFIIGTGDDSRRLTFDEDGNLNMDGNLVLGGTIDTGMGATEVYLQNQNLRTTDAPTFVTLNTGQGAYELYAMDQNVLTASSPTFDGLTLNGNLALGANILTTSNTTLISNLNADLLDGQQGTYYLTAGNLSGTIPSTVLGNSTVYIGTTAVLLNRATAALALTGITSIDGNAATVTNGVYTNAANSFSLINPLTTLAESWIGPSSTTGIYFKGGNVGIGTTNPTQSLDVVGNIRTNGQFISTLATGTAPMQVSSSTMVSNLNADQLDGQHGAYYQVAYTNLSTIGGLANGTGWLYNNGSGTFSYTTPTGLISSLTAGYVPYATSATALGNSNTYYTGTYLGVGLTNPTYTLDISGTFRLSNTAPVFGSNTVIVPASGTLAFGTGVAGYNAYWSTANTLASEQYVALTRGGTNATLTASNGGIVYSGASSLAILSANANSGLALISGGAGSPSWYAPTQGSAIFAGANGALSSSVGNFYWDNSNNRLGIGTSAPTYNLQVAGTLGIGGTAYFAGNVGIGTTSPGAALHVIQTTANQLFFGEAFANPAYMHMRRANGTFASPTDVANGDNVGGFQMQAFSNGGYSNIAAIKGEIDGTYTSGQRPPSRITFYTNIANTVPTEMMRITGSGNVGIGTISPTGKLSVVGQDSSTFAGNKGLMLGGPTASTLSNKVGIDFIGFNRIDYSPEASIGIITTDRTAGELADIYFATRPTTGTHDALLERVRITSSGNVGIGTTSPQKKLEINDADSNTTTSGLRFTNFACTGDDKLTVGAGGDLICGTDQTGGGAGNVVDTLAATLGAANDANALDINNIGKLYAALGTVSVPAYSFQSDSDTGLWSSVANTLNFSTNGAERMRIGSTGNVGIGTTSPGTALDVNGTITVRGGGNNPGTIYNNYVQGNGELYLKANGANPVALRTNGEVNIGNATYLGSANSLAVGGILSIQGTGNSSIAGNVGIGTTNPTTKLSVTSTADENVITVTDSDGTCTFNPESGGAWSCTSDERLKKNIVNMSSSLAKVMGLRPVSFEMKAGGDTNYGFIAQEVQEIIPEAVSVLPNGYLGVAEGKFTPYIVRAIQELSSTQDEQQTAITGITDNQNKIVEQLTNQLADQTLTTDQKITLIGKNLDDLSTEQIKTIKDKISSANNDISDISDRVTTLEDQMKKIQLQNSEEGMGLFETRLGNLEIALNVDGSDVSILGNLSVVGNVDLLNGKLTAKDIEVLGTMKAKDVEAQDSLKGEVLILSEETSGKGKIKAGETEVKIQTPEVSEDAQIYITPKGSTSGKMLYFDDIVEGKSFKVKIDKPAIDDDINFTWLIIK